MKLHMIRAISSPSSSTTGWATLIFAIEFILVYGRTKGAARLDDLRKIKSGVIRGKPEPPMHCSQLRVYQRLWAGLERRHEDRDRRDHPEQFSRLRPRKACRDDLIEESAQRRPVATDIGEQDRLVVQPELFPAEDLEHFIESSDTAGQNRKCIRFLCH